MTTSVVTGGAGFIGSHLVERLVHAGHNVRVLDNLVSGHMSNLATVIDSVEFAKCDIRDRRAVDKVLQGADTVFHLGALGSVPRSIADPLESHDVNATGTLTMLLGARDAGVGRFVSASSSSVYGDHQALPKSEPNIGRPLSPYASTKSIGEQYCRQFWELYELPTTSLRFFNVFGPRQRANHVYAAVIPLFIDAALGGRPLLVNGDGSQSRDFTFVADNVAGIISTSETDADHVFGKTYNLARGGRMDLLTLVETLQSVLNRDLTIEFQPARPGDIPHSFADTSALSRATGYESTHTIEDGIRRTVEWFMTQSVL